MSMDRLIEKIKHTGNPTVAGLDPALEYVPEFIKEKYFTEYGANLRGASEAIFEFGRALIDALHDIVPAVKPQSAYYELYGPDGVRALHRTIAYAKERGMYVIADVKRGDIGTTVQAYASAYLSGLSINGQHFDAFGADCMTVSPYLGSDGVMPLIKACGDADCAIFVLVKTSNASSGELQDKLIDAAPVYELMGGMVAEWGKASMGKFGYSNVGAVVGATYPEQQKRLRELMPHTFFLVPGYGAQGASAHDITGAFDSDGGGAIVNASRSIMCAYKKRGDELNFAQYARDEAIKMRDEIMAAL